MSLRISLAWKPSSPRKVETVSGARSAALVDTPWLVTARITEGESHSLSKIAGVRRRNGTCCSRYTLMPPRNTLSSLTFSSSVIVGVYTGSSMTS